jgi:hypothetical protein
MSVLDRPGTHPDAQTLTERYLDSVAHGVPAGRRAQVTDNLRAAIEAEIAVRTAAGADRTEAERAALEDLGDPRRVADSAAGPRWLVGPRLYPDYLRTLRAVAWVVLPLVAVLVALGAAIAGENPAEVLAAVLSAIVGAVVHVAFWVTLVFAVLDRQGVVLREPDSGWSVDALPAARDNRVGLGETAVGVAIQALLIGLVVWPWQYWPSADAPPVPVLDSDLRPTITAVLVTVLAAGIVLAAIVYRVGRWTVPLAAVNTVLDVAFAGIVVWLVATGRLIDPAFVDALRASPLLDEASAETAAGLLASFIGWAVGLGCAVDVVDSWRKALRGRG